jgi:hypothetical protein
MRLSTRWLSSLMTALLLAGCGQAAPQALQAMQGEALDAQAVAKGPIAEQLKQNAIKPTEFGLLSKALPVPGKVLPFTYLTYEALDNNLVGDLSSILNKLEAIGSNDNLNLIAHTDADGRHDTRRYYLMKLPETKQGVASPYMEMPEDNMASKKALSAAMRWGYSSYPSKARWLNLSSHGGGWMGAIADDGSNDAWLWLPDLGDAVRAGANGKKLDVISFDACLMSSLEVAAEFKDVAGCMVASEDSTYYWGRGYFDTLSKVSRNPAMAPQAIATDLVETVHDTHQGRSYQSFTVSAFDLGQAEGAIAALDKLSGVLLRKVGPYRGQLKDAVRNLKPFMNNAKKDNQVSEIQDLGAALNAFSDIPDKELRQAIGEARSAIFAKRFMLKTRNSHYEGGATSGLSIYLPVHGYKKRYAETVLARTTRWDEFLVELNR